MQVLNQPVHSEPILGTSGRGEIMLAWATCVVSGRFCCPSLSSLDLSVFHNCTFDTFKVCY